MTTGAGLPNPDLNTSAILAELRRELRLLERDLAAPPSEAEFERGSGGLQGTVHDLERNWRLTPQPFGSGAPVVGRAIARFRTAWNDVSTRWYLQPLLMQQMQFNATVVRLAQQVSHLLRMLQPEADAESEGAASRPHQEVALARSLAQTEVLLGRVADRLRELEDAAGPRALESLEARIARLEAGVPIAPATGVAPSAFPASAPGLDYFRFELEFRGDPAAVKERQRVYAELFERGPVIDLGCGRGEFLGLMRERGIAARGVDADPAMVAHCRERGFEAAAGDLLAELEGSPDGGLGGVFSAQTIEHLPPDALVQLMALAHRKLAPGGLLVLETINPECLTALGGSYTRDLTHRQPVHPETAAFLARSAGFTGCEVRYCSPVPDHLRLQLLAPAGPGTEPWRAVLNANAERLNQVLFGYQDYALIARRPGVASGRQG